jgi:hypothetical protein
MKTAKIKQKYTKKKRPHLVAGHFFERVHIVDFIFQFRENIGQKPSQARRKFPIGIGMHLWQEKKKKNGAKMVQKWCKNRPKIGQNRPFGGSFGVKMMSGQ